jgi:hypothetical protein
MTPNGFLTFWKQACGTETPPPNPVQPSSSLFDFVR